MIVRNEEARLARCLESVRGVVDEIVVVDTGSRDATPEIAAAFGARVDRFPWADDFAVARNRALDLAEGDWILVLDADDALAEDDRPLVRPLTERDDVDGFVFPTLSYLGEAPGTDIIRSPFLRLFRRLPGLRYRGALHELIMTEPEWRIAFAPVRVFHYGYLEGPMRAQDKARRNLALAERLVREEPDNPHYLFGLAKEYLRLNAAGQALPLILRARDLMAVRGDAAPELDKAAAACLLRLGRGPEAARLLEAAIPLHPAYTDLVFLQGQAWRQCRRFSEALAAFRRCLGMGEAPLQYPSDVGVGGFRAWTALGLVHLDLEDRPRAAACFRRALRLCPGDRSAACLLVDTLVTLGWEDRRIERLLSRLGGPTPDAPGRWRNLALGCLESGRYRLAEDLLARCPDPADPYLLGLCRLGAGDRAGAAAQLRRVGPSDPHHAEAERHLDLIAWLNGDLPGVEALAQDLDAPQDKEGFALDLAEKLLELGYRERLKEVLAWLGPAAEDPALRARLARLAWRHGAWELARRWLEGAASEAEDHLILARCALGQGRPGAAAVHGRRALEADETSVEACLEMSRALRALAGRLLREDADG